jgi:hypothetical protein
MIKYIFKSFLLDYRVIFISIYRVEEDKILLTIILFSTFKFERLKKNTTAEINS